MSVRVACLNGTPPSNTGVAVRCHATPPTLYFAPSSLLFLRHRIFSLDNFSRWCASRRDSLKLCVSCCLLPCSGVCRRSHPLPEPNGFRAQLPPALQTLPFPIWISPLHRRTFLQNKCVPDPIFVCAKFHPPPYNLASPDCQGPLQVGELQLGRKRKTASQEPYASKDDSSKEEWSSTAHGQLGLHPDCHLFKCRSFAD